MAGWRARYSVGRETAISAGSRPSWGSDVRPTVRGCGRSCILRNPDSSLRRYCMHRHELAGVRRRDSVTVSCGRAILLVGGRHASRRARCSVTCARRHKGTDFRSRVRRRCTLHSRTHSRGRASRTAKPHVGQLHYFQRHYSLASRSSTCLARKHTALAQAQVTR